MTPEKDDDEELEEDWELEEIEEEDICISDPHDYGELAREFIKHKYQTKITSKEIGNEKDSKHSEKL